MQTKPTVIAAIIVTVLVTLFKESCTTTGFDLEKVVKTLPPAPIAHDTVYVFKYDTVSKFRTVVKYLAPDFIDQAGTTDTVLLRDTVTLSPAWIYNEFTDTIFEPWGNAILTILSPQEISAYSLEVNPKECPPPPVGPGHSYVATPASITIPKSFAIGAGPGWNFIDNKPNVSLVAGWKGVGANVAVGQGGVHNAGLTYSLRW